MTIGILSMLFAGILYSWSILKAPLADAFGWNASQLTMNFTLTMCFFCLGGVGGGLLARRLGTRLTIALGGALACIGFVLTARLDGSSLPMLYLSYGVITATGIGFAYNVVLSTVQAWFPDKGHLLRRAADGLWCLLPRARLPGRRPHPESRRGLAGGLPLPGRRHRNCAGRGRPSYPPPRPGTVLPQPKAAANRVQEDFEAADYTTGQMLRRFTFWRAFLCIIFLAAMGNTVISFAKDLSLSVGPAPPCPPPWWACSPCATAWAASSPEPSLTPWAAAAPCCWPTAPPSWPPWSRCCPWPSTPSPVRGRPVHHRHLLRRLPHHLLRLYLLLLRRQVLLPQLLRHELQPDRRLLHCHRRQRPAHPNRGYAARWCCCWCSPWPPWRSTSASSAPEPPQADKALRRTAEGFVV